MVRAVAVIGLTGLLGLAGGVASAVEQPTVGNATVIVKTVTGILGGDRREVRLQDDVYHNEMIETGAKSATEVSFLDGTMLTLGPNSLVTLDRFVYDPDTTKGAFVLTVTQGVLRFASGNLPSEAYTFHTPVATLGIRGTVLTIVVLGPGEFESEGTSNVTIEDGALETVDCIDDKVFLDSSTPGVSTTIFKEEDGTCSSTPAGPQPDEYAQRVDDMDQTILASLDPGAGDDEDDDDGPPPPPIGDLVRDIVSATIENPSVVSPTSVP